MTGLKSKSTENELKLLLIRLKTNNYPTLYKAKLF